jgi:hypothetical protein
MQKEYILYGTSACHLCEEAEVIMSIVLQNHDILYMKKDIVDDEYLLRQYALTIPVLKSVATQTELNWPFTEDAVEAFIRQ